MDDTGSTALIAGLSTAGLGTAGFVISWILYDLGMQYRGELEHDRFRYKPRYVANRRYAVLAGGVGAGLLSASAPLLLPDYNEAPALSWIGGGLGLAGVITGILLSAAGQECTTTVCDSEQYDSALGPMVLIQSIPLLAIPATYAVRSLLNSTTVSASAASTPGGAMLTLSVAP